MCRSGDPTDEGAQVIFDLTGRTVFAEQPSGGKAGRQLLMTLFETETETETETENESYTWLTNTV